MTSYLVSIIVRYLVRKISKLVIINMCHLLNAKVREVDQPNQRMVGLAVYTNPNSAAYARKKLHGFEYPPG